METLKKYLRMILNIVIPIGITGSIFYFGPIVIRFFMPFIIGWLISMIANPLVRFLEKKVNIVRKHSSMIIVISVLALIIIAIYYLTAKFITEGLSFVRDLPNMLEIFKIELQDILNRFSRIIDIFPEEIRLTVAGIGGNLDSYIGELLASIGEPTMHAAGNVARGIPNIFVSIVVTILSSYFFIADKEKLTLMLDKVIPNSVQKYIWLIKENTLKLVGGYFLAQIKIMLVVFVVLFIGFFILRIPYSGLLAFFIAFLDFLPIFGTGTALIPWAIFQLFSGEFYIGVGLSILYVVSQTVRQIIQPKIVGDTLGLSPLPTLFFMYLGFKFQGITGMILAVPMGMIIIEFYNAGVFDSFFSNGKALINEINKFRRLPELNKRSANENQKADKGKGSMSEM